MGHDSGHGLNQMRKHSWDGLGPRLIPTPHPIPAGFGRFWTILDDFGRFWTIWDDFGRFGTILDDFDRNKKPCISVTQREINHL